MKAMKRIHSRLGKLLKNGRSKEIVQPIENGKWVKMSDSCWEQKGPSKANFCHQKQIKPNLLLHHQPRRSSQLLTPHTISFISMNKHSKKLAISTLSKNADKCKNYCKWSIIESCCWRKKTKRLANLLRKCKE